MRPPPTLLHQAPAAPTPRPSRSGGRCVGRLAPASGHLKASWTSYRCPASASCTRNSATASPFPALNARPVTVPIASVHVRSATTCRCRGGRGFLASNPLSSPRMAELRPGHFLLTAGLPTRRTHVGTPSSNTKTQTSSSAAHHRASRCRSPRRDRSPLPPDVVPAETHPIAWFQSPTRAPRFRPQVFPPPPIVPSPIIV